MCPASQPSAHAKTGNLLSSPWKFAKHGQSGQEISELLPHIATCAANGPGIV